jgi:stage II sporulation protein D
MTAAGRARLRICLSAGITAVVVWWGGAAGPARATESLVVRVGILVDRPSVQIGADGPVSVEDASRPPVGAPAASPPSGVGWIVTPGSAGGLDLSGVPAGPVVRLTAQQGLLRADGRPYRGLLEVRRTPAGRITVVDEVDLESYLYGVIKGEVDPRWPPESVRAQAVAARTLAVQRMSVRGASTSAAGFDLPATTDAQVYLGAAA